jgi:DNA polymerase delta subunit 1
MLGMLDVSCTGDPHTVVSIVDLGIGSTGDFVYDLTTESGHFAAGIGTLVVHNTDSVMCILDLGDANRHNLHAHFIAAEKLAADISATFPDPVELEYEKAYFPYLLFSKKRYAGLMYTKPDSPDYIDVKGLQLVRRDNCPLVKDVSSAILDKIMYQRSAALAIDEARKCVLRVLTNQEPLEKFIVSKSLRSDYKNTSQPHLNVAKKIMQRTGTPVPSGVRVPYVFVEVPDKATCLLADKAEDPEYVKTHDLPLDVLYYINNQLHSPVCALLELLVDDPNKEVFADETIAPLILELQTRRAGEVKIAKRVCKNKANNQAEITTFFTRK